MFSAKLKKEGEEEASAYKLLVFRSFPLKGIYKNNLGNHDLKSIGFSPRFKERSNG